MSNEEDPKIVARNARKLPETEKILKQFCSLESGNFATPAYREAYDRMKKDKKYFEIPMACIEEDGCNYIANCQEDIDWHARQCGHTNFREIP